MKYEITFNPDIYKKQNNLILVLLYKQGKKNATIKILIGIFLIFLSLLPATTYPALSFFLVLYGALSSFFGILYLYRYRVYGKEYQKSVDASASKRLADNATIATLEFEEDYFRYADSYTDIKQVWENFLSYHVENDTLFLIVGSDISHSFVVNEEELGKEAFNSVLALVKRKINT